MAARKAAFSALTLTKMAAPPAGAAGEGRRATLPWTPSKKNTEQTDKAACSAEG